MPLPNKPARRCKQDLVQEEAVQPGRASLSYEAEVSGQHEGQSSACPGLQGPIICPLYSHLPTRSWGKWQEAGASPDRGQVGGAFIPP